MTARLTGVSFSATHRLTTYSSCHFILPDTTPFVHLSFLILCPEPSSALLSPLSIRLCPANKKEKERQPAADVSQSCNQLIWHHETKLWAETLILCNTHPGWLASRGSCDNYVILHKRGRWKQKLTTAQPCTMLMVTKGQVLQKLRHALWLAGP